MYFTREDIRLLDGVAGTSAYCPVLNIPSVEYTWSDALVDPTSQGHLIHFEIQWHGVGIDLHYATVPVSQAAALSTQLHLDVRALACCLEET